MTLQGFYTNKGRTLAAKIAAGTTELTVTRIVAGSGHTADIPSAIDLPAQEQTLSVGQPSVSGYTATLRATLPETEAASSYQLTELGVYAADPDVGEILFQVYQLDRAADITALGEGVLCFYLRQSIGAQGVTVTCSGAGVVLEGDIAELRARDAYADHRNLLDNPFFSVNQRGWASGDAAVQTYTIDRWKIGSSPMNVTVNADHSVTLVNNSGTDAFFEQVLASVPAGHKTLSVNAVVETGTVEAMFQENGGVWESPISFEVTSGISHGSGVLSSDKQMRVFLIVHDGASVTIKAIKLENGTVSTLANDTPPDCGQELLKCQRYFQIFKTQSLRKTDKDDFRPTMRVDPVTSTITIGGTTYYAASADL